jgi:glutathione synthase/RimK-type ligase-like ATP-grasp enzyme
VKHIKLFEQYLAERKSAKATKYHPNVAPDANSRFKDYLNKVNFLLAGEKIEGLTGKNNKRIYGKINDVCLEKLFNSFYAKGDYKKDLDVNPKLPLIYYGGNSKEALDFIKKYNISEDVMYNLPDVMKVSGNKSDFYKMFKDSDFIPKAVYKKEDAKDLQFPVIAKPDDGHSGLGIEIFDTYEDLEKSKGKFENYSEAKDLDKEFRVLLMNEDPVLVHERVSLNENEIKDKEVDEQTEFTYVDQDMSKLDFMDKVNDICKKVREKLKLGLWSIDLMIDKGGDCWVAEINSASGMAADKMARVYVKVYEDFYGEELPKELKDHLNEEYIKPIYKINLKENANQIKKSKCSVNYQNVIDGKKRII